MSSTGTITIIVHTDYFRADEKYRGPYKLDPSTKQVSGNPASAACVTDTLHAIENKCRADGGSRTHAQAMTIEYMRDIMQWSEKQCPNECANEPVNTQDVSEWHLITKHLRARSMFTSAFTIWPR